MAPPPPCAQGGRVDVDRRLEEAISGLLDRRNAGATINFSADNIASTDNLNTNGILGSWATVGGQWACNSINGADGLIVAYTGYADVTRRDSGSQVIAAKIRPRFGSEAKNAVLTSGECAIA